MTGSSLLPLALLAIDDASALPVLGDAILESGWFDKRVMQMMLPLKPIGRTVSPTQRQRARRLRGEFKRGYPDAFRAFVTQETTGLTRQRWARAVAAVLLFGTWSKKRWPGVPGEIWRFTDARFLVNGEEILSHGIITITRRDRGW